MGVIVLGMHRGGTSAVCRIVSLMGLEVGDPELLIEATPENPGGHWEVEEISALDEELLGELGGRWSAPPECRAADLVEMARGSWGEKAGALLAATYSGRAWVWKDPRSCLLMPFWREVLDEDPVVVAVVRNPLEIAESLARRNGFLIGYSLALWERYQRSAVAGAEGLATFVVSYDELLSEPERTWDALSEFLGEHGQPVDPRAGRAEALSFLDGRFRHHRHGLEDLRSAPGASPNQLHLYEVLSARTGVPSRAWGAAGAEDLGEETPGLQLLFDEHQRLSAWKDLAEQLRAGMDEVDERIVASRADAAHAWSEVRRLEAELADALEGRLAVVEALERALEERDGWKEEAERLRGGIPARVWRSVASLLRRPYRG